MQTIRIEIEGRMTLELPVALQDRVIVTNVSETSKLEKIKAAPDAQKTKAYQKRNAEKAAEEAARHQRRLAEVRTAMETSTTLKEAADKLGIKICSMYHWLNTDPSLKECIGSKLTEFSKPILNPVCPKFSSNSVKKRIEGKNAFIWANYCTERKECVVLGCEKTCAWYKANITESGKGAAKA
jgi:hypothetical protein